MRPVRSTYEFHRESGKKRMLKVFATPVIQDDCDHADDVKNRRANGAKRTALWAIASIGHDDSERDNTTEDLTDSVERLKTQFLKRWPFQRSLMSPTQLYIALFDVAAILMVLYAFGVKHETILEWLMECWHTRRRNNVCSFANNMCMY